MEEKTFDELCHNVRDLIQDIRDAVVFLAKTTASSATQKKLLIKQRLEPPLKRI